MRPALIQVTRVGRHSERVFQNAISLVEQFGSADALPLSFFRNALVSSAWRHGTSRRRVGICRVHKKWRCAFLGSIKAPIPVQSKDRSFKSAEWCETWERQSCFQSGGPCGERSPCAPVCSG